MDKFDIEEKLLSIMSKEELEELVNEKAMTVNGIMNKGGLMFLVAKDFDISVSKDVYVEESDIERLDFQVNIKDLSFNHENIVLVGRIKNKSRIHTFKKKDGSKGFVGNFILKDLTGEIKVVLWNEKTSILESKSFTSGTPIMIIGCYLKKGKEENIEVHLSYKSEIVLSPREVSESSLPKIVESQRTDLADNNGSIPLCSLSEFAGREVSLRVEVLSLGSPKTFERKDSTTGYLLKIKIGDGSGYSYINFWDDDIEKKDLFNVGKVYIVKSVRVRLNTYNDLYEANFGGFSEIRKTVKPPIALKKFNSILDTQDIGVIYARVSEVGQLKEINKGSDINFILKLVLTDPYNKDFSLTTNIWGYRATKWKVILQEGLLLHIFNFSITKNPYTNDSELNLNDNSYIFADI